MWSCSSEAQELVAQLARPLCFNGIREDDQYDSPCTWYGNGQIIETCIDEFELFFTINSSKNLTCLKLQGYCARLPTPKGMISQIGLSIKVRALIFAYEVDSRDIDQEGVSINMIVAIQSHNEEFSLLASSQATCDSRQSLANEYL